MSDDGRRALDQAHREVTSLAARLDRTISPRAGAALRTRVAAAIRAEIDATLAPLETQAQPTGTTRGSARPPDPYARRGA